MLFDKFLLAVESRDLSQADKILIRVSSFPKMSDGYFWMIKFAVIPNKNDVEPFHDRELECP